MANKHDLTPEKDLSQIIGTFNLYELENFEIISISAKPGYNMAHAFTKFYSLLTDKQIKKSQLAEAISIYGSGGDLILSKADEEREMNQKVLEGGFFAAISAFYNKKFNAETKVIKFENAEHGTFLVARSNNYIASVLWTKDLGVEIEESEDALMELLNHLENAGLDPEDKKAVAFHCEHYITNLI